jgi:E3 ubiquitin-protein ligase HUWE1
MERVLKEHDIPEDKRVLLFTYIRLAHSFPNYEKRKLFVQTRLQSLSILVYSSAIQEHTNSLLYDGLIEELVDVLTVKRSYEDPTTPTHTPSSSSSSTAAVSQQQISPVQLQPAVPPFPEIKAASLKTLTAIIHLEKTNKLTEIIETTQAASYHGLLPTLVRKCVDHLIDFTKEPFPHQFATSLFSFLYHLATYDTGGDALVKCGIMETLLKVVNHNHNSQEFIMFVTRAVRVIDLITNLDMSSFEAHSGLVAFINRLEYEVNECRKEQPFVIKVKSSVATSDQTANNEGDDEDNKVDDSDDTLRRASMKRSLSPDTGDDEQQTVTMQPMSEVEDDESHQPPTTSSTTTTTTKNGLTCYHQRSALLKSILNFFKKAIADSSNNTVPNLGDSIRHMMDNSLPNSLKHIISNADYYGPSLFLLATDVVQLFIFQEPSQLSQLQENGLTDVILHALLKKNVPATREVLGSLPTVFSALCLNTPGLNAFIESRPFDKLFQVLLSPDYLPAMRRRRNAEQLQNGNGGPSSLSNGSSGTASQLGSAMDELMRHQPSLRVEAMNSIIKLLNQLIEMGQNPNYICQKQSSSSSSKSAAAAAAATAATTNTTNLSSR